jgi:hypothetical protein
VLLATRAPAVSGSLSEQPVEVHGCPCGDDVAPPAVDETGVGERDEGIQSGDRVADVMHHCLERPEPLLLTSEQEPQDEALYALGCLGQVVGLVGHGRLPRGRPARACRRRYG